MKRLLSRLGGGLFVPRSRRAEAWASVYAAVDGRELEADGGEAEEES